MSDQKDVYIIASASPEPLSEAQLREAFETDEVELLVGVEGTLFSVRADDSRVDVHFDSRPDGLGWTPDLLVGSPEAREFLEKARGFYRVSFVPGKPQPSVAVFEALWTVRALLEKFEGIVIDITAFKLHLSSDVEEITELDFDIRDHVSVHAVEMEGGRVWVHSHGLTKFGMAELELFQITEDDLPAAETFMHELSGDIAFGHGPPPRTPVATSVGVAFMLIPSDEGRANLRVPLDFFEGHEGPMLTVVGTDGRHTLTELLSQYRERFEEETDEERQALLTMAEKSLPAFKARFQRKGLMEPLTFLVRAPFEVHPEGEDESPEAEQLWAEVMTWEDATIVGRLVDGGQATTEWRKGAHVEIEESQVNAVALSREGRSLDPEEMELFLRAELPA